MGCAAVATVVLAQAVLGGVAVKLVTPAWATIAHACLAQLFFALMVAICVGLYARRCAGRLRTAAPVICTVALFAQTILGAAVRYQRGGSGRAHRGRGRWRPSW